MTRALLKTDEPVAYRVIVTRTLKPEREKYHETHGLAKTLVHRYGPYATLSGAKGQATSQTSPWSYTSWDSVARIEVIRAEAWEVVE